MIRFVELYHQVRFPQALTLLRQWRGWAPVLHETGEFYRVQLHRHGEALAYRKRSLAAVERSPLGLPVFHIDLKTGLTQTVKEVVQDIAGQNSGEFIPRHGSHVRPRCQ